MNIGRQLACFFQSFLFIRHRNIFDEYFCKQKGGVSGLLFYVVFFLDETFNLGLFKFYQRT